MAEVSGVRLVRDEKDRACVLWFEGRTPRMKRYAEAQTAQAIVGRLLENGSPHRGFAR